MMELRHNRKDPPATTAERSNRFVRGDNRNDGDTLETTQRETQS